MGNTATTINSGKSKYIRNARELDAFRKASVAYVFALFVLPQYFGIPNPVFDLTAVRITIIILLSFIISDYDRNKAFARVLTDEKVWLVLLPYILVLFYTMVLRADPNAFLNPVTELLEMYLLIYLIKNVFGMDDFLRLIIGMIYFMAFMGLLEAAIGVSPFSFLCTINGIYTGRFIRGGHYRIMSNASHSLGYGLMLVTMLPFAGYDVDTKEYNALRRPILLTILMVNIFLTGSRSTLGVSFAEIFLMFLLSDLKYLKANIIYLSTALITFGLVLMATFKTSFGNYIMLQLTSLYDSLFNTTYSAAYGGDVAQLKSSKAYRDLLEEIFHVDWVNPILGIGRKRGFRTRVNGRTIKSIDNFYIAEFVRYAYPGMYTYIFFLVSMGFCMVRDFIKTRSALVRMTIIGTAIYCLNIKVVDSLQTFKYLYILFAIYICCDKTAYVPQKNKSRYIKKEKHYFARYK